MARFSSLLPEARIIDTNHVLIVLSPSDDVGGLDGFCGAVITDPSAGLPDLSGKAVYLCGDVSKAEGLDLSAAARVQVIRERSHGYGERDDGVPWPLVSLGRVPLRVHAVGVYYRCFFDPSVDFFDRIRSEHTFQSLTESTKPAKAHRTGIYLAPVRREGDALCFRLLRCSTNLSGPTEGFRATDRHIVDALNQEAALIFTDAAPLNHVLAQTYHNTPADAEKKQAKARISPHADKTKDMPTNETLLHKRDEIETNVKGYLRRVVVLKVLSCRRRHQADGATSELGAGVDAGGFEAWLAVHGRKVEKE